MDTSGRVWSTTIAEYTAAQAARRGHGWRRAVAVVLLLSFLGAGAGASDGPHVAVAMQLPTAPPVTVTSGSGPADAPATDSHASIPYTRPPPLGDPAVDAGLPPTAPPTAPPGALGTPPTPAPEVTEAAPTPSAVPVDASTPPPAHDDHAAPGPNPALQIGDYRQVIPGLVFPTLPSARMAPGYHDPRDGGQRVHMAADLFGDKHWPLFATIAGTICGTGGITGGESAAGYHLTLCGQDCRRYRHLHLNDDTPGTDDGAGGTANAFAAGIAEGVMVAAGQHIGYLGDSGNAEDTPPHLHLDIFDDRVRDPYGQPRIDPYPSLEAARANPSTAAWTATATSTPDLTPAAIAPDLDNAIAPGGGDDIGRADEGAVPSLPNRFGGSDRIATAIEVTRLWERVDTVVVAGATDPLEGLVAAGYAAAVGAPLLLSTTEVVDPRVADALRTLAPSRVVLVGAAASLDVEAVVGDHPSDIERLIGDDVMTLGATVATHLWDHGADGVLALVATTAGLQAAELLPQLPAPGAVIIPVPAEGTAPPELAAVVERSSQVIVVGDSPLLDAVTSVVDLADQSGDAAAVPTAVMVVTAANWPDAVIALAAAARTGATVTAWQDADVHAASDGPSVPVVVIGGPAAGVPDMTELPAAILAQTPRAQRRRRR